MNRNINYWGNGKGEQMVPSGPSQVVGRTSGSILDSRNLSESVASGTGHSM